MNNVSTGRPEFGVRIAVAGAVALLVFAGLCVKLWRLQILQGESYLEAAHSNRMRLVRSAPTRGRILDSQGRVLAENQPSFTFSVSPGDLERTSDIVAAYSGPLGIAEERFRRLLDRAREAPKFVPFPIKKNLTIEEVSLIKSKIESKGALVESRALRSYPMKEVLCHVIGYNGEISAPELTEWTKLGYHAGDSVGKSGIEKAYEHYLRGEDGWEQIEIDAKGRRLGNVFKKPTKNGADITLTVDSAFQKFCEEAFLHRTGAVTAVDPETGRVLAMVSRPGFDLNIFSPSITERNWRELMDDPLHPLENRAVRGKYSPASTFKIITALAGLNEKVITLDRKFSCGGEYEIAGQAFRCWNAYGHGKIALHRAIVESCDIYFYELGLKLGPEKMAHYAALFGMGTPTGLGLPQELPGLAPTPEWKKRRSGETWKDGETISLAIGQGYLDSTPMQLAMMTAAMANGGKLLRPTLVSKITSEDGAALYEHIPVVRWEIPLDPKVRAAVENAMKDVVHTGHGTGRRARIPDLVIHAKTGTSQVIREKERTKDEEKIPYHERTHAMFVAYVNDRPKKIALAVVVEHGGGGGATAAPIARKILAYYYGKPDPGDPEPQ